MYNILQIRMRFISSSETNVYVQDSCLISCWVGPSYSTRFRQYGYYIIIWFYCTVFRIKVDARI